MQPTFTQVPPNNFRSMTATFIPAPASLPAKDGPDCPVPMIIASYFAVMESTSCPYKIYLNE
jgi:hypothetical protein